MEKIFVYGTLQDPAIQLKVFGRVVTMSQDSLGGYKKETIQLSGKPFFIAVPDAGSRIKGMVFEASPEEVRLMDEYETKAYQRAEVTLASGQRAWVYRQPAD